MADSKERESRESFGEGRVSVGPSQRGLVKPASGPAAPDDTAWLEAALAAAAHAARAAGDLIRKGYRRGIRADEKSAKDLVTEFDRASEAELVRQLTELDPSIPILAEEGGDHPVTAETPSTSLRWCVDPLDGTTNFVHGHPFWCVSVGLMRRDATTGSLAPLLGVVWAPEVSLLWRGIAAGSEHEATRALRNGEPCSVSRTEALRASLLATGFPPDRSHAPWNNFDSFMRVKKAAQAVRRCGSAAMDVCLVADGTYDGYWERRLHIWDVAAAAAIAIAGGARVTNLSGDAPDYARGHVAISNGVIHDELIEAIGARDEPPPASP